MAPGTDIDRTEERTAAWLTQGLQEGIKGSKDDFLFNLSTKRPQRMSLYWFQRFQRQLKIFRWLEQMRFDTFLDIGSGIEHYPLHARQRYGVDAYYTDITPEFVYPCDGAWSGKKNHAVVSNLRRLPFPDGAFDVVVCTEVLEHLVRPVEAIAELTRVARRHLIVTSLESWEPRRWRRLLAHYRTDTARPHIERNFFSPDDFRALFGSDCHFENLFAPRTMPASPFDATELVERTYGALVDPDELVLRLAASVGDGTLSDTTMGILVVKTPMPPPPAPPDPARDAELARWILERAAYVERSIAFTMLGLHDGHIRPEAPDAPVSDALLARVRCPGCGERIARDDGTIRCVACASEYPARFGVPILTPQRDIDDAAAERTALDRLCGADRERRAIVRRLSRRLRRSEGEAGVVGRVVRKLAGG